MALSNIAPNVKMYPNAEGKFTAVHIQWNKHTRAWHVRSNEGSLYLHTGTIIPTPMGHRLINKVWDYDVSHPERINFNKVPLTRFSMSGSLSESLAAFALTLAE